MTCTGIFIKDKVRSNLMLHVSMNSLLVAYSPTKKFEKTVVVVVTDNKKVTVAT